MIYMILYEEESQGQVSPEKISTRWSARCHVIYHVHIAELKETAQVPPPTNRFWPFFMLELYNFFEVATTLCCNFRYKYVG